ncbi:hypothetical protein BDR03DRAFT_427151 [Suillus americanus]|nr:hypothetical protein BDR03DRAFT_427151 [Suillus americanus]
MRRSGSSVISFFFFFLLLLVLTENSVAGGSLLTPSPVESCFAFFGDCPISFAVHPAFRIFVISFLLFLQIQSLQRCNAFNSPWRARSDQVWSSASLFFLLCELHGDSTNLRRLIMILCTSI